MFSLYSVMSDTHYVKNHYLYKYIYYELYIYMYMLQLRGLNLKVSVWKSQFPEFI
jgi:hypothetical protein